MKSNGGVKSVKSPAPTSPPNSATDALDAFDGTETVVKISGGISTVSLSSSVNNNNLIQ